MAHPIRPDKYMEIKKTKNPRKRKKHFPLDQDQQYHRIEKQQPQNSHGNPSRIPKQDGYDSISQKNQQKSDAATDENAFDLERVQRIVAGLERGKQIPKRIHTKERQGNHIIPTGRSVGDKQATLAHTGRTQNKFRKRKGG